MLWVEQGRGSWGGEIRRAAGGAGQWMDADSGTDRKQEREPMDV